VRAGTSPGDLQEVRAVTLDRPDGWITFDVSAEPGDDGEGLCVILSSLPSQFAVRWPLLILSVRAANRFTRTFSKLSSLEII